MQNNNLGIICSNNNKKRGSWMMNRIFSSIKYLEITWKHSFYDEHVYIYE